MHEDNRNVVFRYKRSNFRVVTQPGDIVYDEVGFNIKNIGIFGSVINGKVRKSSDVDVLVEFSKTIDLLDFVALEKYLSEQTGAKIDLVSLNALRPEFKDTILKEVVYI